MTAPDAPTVPRRRRFDWAVAWTVAEKDLRAVLRSKAVALPMLLVPLMLLLVVPTLMALAALARETVDLEDSLQYIPGGLADPIKALPVREQLMVLILGYLLAPLFIIVPLMVSAVLAADTFAGEKDRRTLESLLHLPIGDRELLVGKTLASLVPAILISWLGFVCYSVIVNTLAWPRVGRIFVPTGQWVVLILWVAPAVAVLGLGIMVRVSARARGSQEANQLGGAVVLPLIFLAVGQSTALLLSPVPVGVLVGVVLWAIGLAVLVRGARTFTRDRLATRL